MTLGSLSKFSIQIQINVLYLDPQHCSYIYIHDFVFFREFLRRSAHHTPTRAHGRFSALPVARVTRANIIAHFVLLLSARTLINFAKG